MAGGGPQKPSMLDSLKNWVSGDNKAGVTAEQRTAMVSAGRTFAEGGCESLSNTDRQAVADYSVLSTAQKLSVGPERASLNSAASTCSIPKPGG